jgi:hypothetical protein
MAITDSAECNRLILQIERDLLARAHLRSLLTDADTTVADHRQKLRAVKARLERARRVNPVLVRSARSEHWRSRHST